MTEPWSGAFNASTGRPGRDTPSGTFTVHRQIDGWRTSEYGRLYRPKYIYQGIAIHGYTSVPAYPASAGCIRVSLEAMDYIWANGLIPIGERTWIYG